MLRGVNSNECIFSNKDGRFGDNGCVPSYNDQHFKFEKLGSSTDTYMIRGVNSNECIFSNKDGRFGDNGCEPNYNDQHWKVTPV
jgi:hypothetical protein